MAHWAVFGDGRRLLQDVHDGKAVLHLDGHEQARHDREVEAHVALVAVAAAEVGDGILRPLVGLGQQHAVFVLAVQVAAQLLEEDVRLGQVLATGAVALVQVGDGVEAQAVDAALQPEVEDAEDGLVDGEVVVVEVGLVRVEAVPVKGVGDRVPGPVGQLEVLEDDAGFLEAVARVAPDVEVAFGAARRRTAGALEPRVLVGGVVDDQFGDDAQAAAMGLVEQTLEVVEGAVDGVDAGIVGDVVAVVAQRRRVERQQPEGRDAQVLQVIELLDNAGEIADAVAVAVAEGADVQLVDDGVLVPERIVFQRNDLGLPRAANHGNTCRHRGETNEGTPSQFYGEGQHLCQGGRAYFCFAATRGGARVALRRASRRNDSAALHLRTTAA